LPLFTCNETLQRRPDRGKGCVIRNALKLRSGTHRVEVSRAGLGKKINEVAIDDQRQTPTDRPLRKHVDKPGEQIATLEDLIALLSSEMQIGNHVNRTKLFHSLKMAKEACTLKHSCVLVK